MSKILLIDDEPVVLRSLERLLANAGHHCESAFNAPEAMERLARETYELALSDVNMLGGERDRAGPADVSAAPGCGPGDGDRGG